MIAEDPTGITADAAYPAYFGQFGNKEYFAGLHLKYGEHREGMIRIYFAVIGEDECRKALLISMPDHLATPSHLDNRKNKA